MLDTLPEDVVKAILSYNRYCLVPIFFTSHFLREIAIETKPLWETATLSFEQDKDKEYRLRDNVSFYSLISYTIVTKSGWRIPYSLSTHTFYLCRNDLPEKLRWTLRSDDMKALRSVKEKSFFDLIIPLYKCKKVRGMRLWYFEYISRNCRKTVSPNSNSNAPLAPLTRITLAPAGYGSMPINKYAAKNLISPNVQKLVLRTVSFALPLLPNGSLPPDKNYIHPRSFRVLFPNVQHLVFMGNVYFMHSETLNELFRAFDDNKSRLLAVDISYLMPIKQLNGERAKVFKFDLGGGKDCTLAIPSYLLSFSLSLALNSRKWRDGDIWKPNPFYFNFTNAKNLRFLELSVIFPNSSVGKEYVKTLFSGVGMKGVGKEKREERMFDASQVTLMLRFLGNGDDLDKVWKRALQFVMEVGFGRLLVLDTFVGTKTKEFMEESSKTYGRKYGRKMEIIKTWQECVARKRVEVARLLT